APLALAAPAVAADATLSGTVTDQSNAPVANVTVMATQYPGFSPIYAATTDATGQYTMSIAVSGLFVVHFSPPAGSHLAAVTYNQHPGDTGVDLLTIPAGASVNLDAQLPPTGAITGTVTGPSGSPVPGTVVTARSNPIGALYGSATTDASGRYTIEI